MAFPQYDFANLYDSLEAKELIQSMSRTPLLSYEEERTLVERLSDRREFIDQLDTQLQHIHTRAERENILDSLCTQRMLLREDMERLFFANFRLVLEFARKVRHGELMDRIQWGSIGLLRAIEKFDPTRTDPKTGSHIRFSTYATYWIRHFIQRGTEHHDTVVRYPSHIRDTIRRIQRSRLTYIQQFGAFPTDDQLARFSGEDIALVTRYSNGLQLSLSLYREYEDDSYHGDGSTTTLEHALPYATTSTEESVIEAERIVHLRSVIAQALDTLEHYVDPETEMRPYIRHAKILRLRFRIGEPPDDSSPLRSLSDIGRMICDDRSPNGIKRPRVRQLYQTGIEWLRAHVPELRAAFEDME